MANVIRDIGEIWTRIFDHRPFLNGEIKVFVREFEETRADREVEGLFQILESVTETKDTHIDRIKLAADSHLPPLAIKLDTAQAKCDLILERESKFKEEKVLENLRAQRKAEWESFIEDISVKCAKVDATFEEKERDLKDFYADLERKLHIS